MHVKRFFIPMILGLLLMGNRAGAIKYDITLNEKPVALMNGVAHLGNGETIENAIITFAQGEITLVADARLVRLDLTGYEVMDIFGKHVYFVKDCSKNKKTTCFDIVTNTQTRQLTENEPANLLVSAYALKCAENYIVRLFINGQAKPGDQYTIKENKLKYK